MHHPRSQYVVSTLAALALLMEAACSTPVEEERKSPLWISAQISFSEGDFEDALKKLDSVAQQEPHLRESVAPWRAVTLAALARGYLELANAYDEGDIYHHHRVVSFRRTKNAYESKSRGPTLALADLARDLPSVLADVDTIALDFPFPGGSSSPSSLTAFIRQGRSLKDSDVEKALSYTLRRSMMSTLAEVVGRSDDLEAARALFEGGPVYVTRSAFFAFVGRALCQQADLFVESRINDLDMRDVMLRTSEDLLDYTRGAQARQARMLDLWKDELTRRTGLKRKSAR